MILEIEHLSAKKQFEVISCRIARFRRITASFSPMLGDKLQDLIDRACNDFNDYDQIIINIFGELHNADSEVNKFFENNFDIFNSQYI